MGLGAEHDENGAAGTGRSEERGVFAPGPLLKGVQRSSERGRGKDVAGVWRHRRPIRASCLGGGKKMEPVALCRACGAATAL